MTHFPLWARIVYLALALGVIGFFTLWNRGIKWPF